MSQDIIKELNFFWQAFLLGIMIAIFYDTIRIFRRVCKHGVILTAIEDFLFWFICCLKIFEMFIRENNGTLRLFAIAASIVGMLIYHKLVSRLYVVYVSRFLQGLLRLCMKILIIVFRPMTILAKCMKKMRKTCSQRSEKVLKHAKNRLTRKAKEIIMILCKR